MSSGKKNHAKIFKNFLKYQNENSHQNIAQIFTASELTQRPATLATWTVRKSEARTTTTASTIGLRSEMAAPMGMTAETMEGRGAIIAAHGGTIATVVLIEIVV